MSESLKKKLLQIEQMAIQALQKNDKLKKDLTRLFTEKVHEVVYMKYFPKKYQRTGLLGNPKSVQIDNTSNGIAMYNTRTDDGKYIPEVIETGEGYDFHSSNRSYGYERPRPFVAVTRNEINAKQIHIIAVKDYLESLGLQVFKQNYRMTGSTRKFSR